MSGSETDVFEPNKETSNSLPDELRVMLSGYKSIKDEVGCSSAGVYKFFKDDESLYLKIEKYGAEPRREYEMLKWLNGRLPVPQIKFYTIENGFSYMLTDKVNGYSASDFIADAMTQSYEGLVKVLADGLKMLQSVIIDDCPYSNTLDIKLHAALFNIENQLVDMNDFEEGNKFADPKALYDWLILNKPDEELSFTHGDYCLPNIYIDGDKVTGFLDWGRGGIADKWQDIALCVRSLGYNLGNIPDKDKYIDMLFDNLNTIPDWQKIDYYILLDELF